MRLVIGDKNLSSWSMRPWLVLKRAGLSFEEVVVRLNRDNTTAEILKWSPTAQVPCLVLDGGEAIWDSMAIAVWAVEQRPDAGLWPSDPIARALARSAACEMHSGFAPLRAEHPMNLALRTRKEPSEAVAKNLRRLVESWGGLRRRFGQGGAFLFGDWGVVDSFYTPVATRIRSYGLDLAAHGDDGTAQAYVEALLSTPEFLEWERAALAEAGAP
ncbi:MAG TPA: glutathione S-transferase family protein [Caulobacteraceae bacterium]|nr:glutathione S-transferase family protein [Caulobacteraceae bacterium]